MSRWVILQSRPRGSFVNGKTKANIVVLFNLIYLIIRHETSKRISPLCQLLIRKKRFSSVCLLKERLFQFVNFVLRLGKISFNTRQQLNHLFYQRHFQLLFQNYLQMLSSAALDLNVSSSQKVAYTKTDKVLEVKMPFRDKTSLIY